MGGTFENKKAWNCARCRGIMVEEVEQKHCKCKGHKGLDMFSGENATCNDCLAHRLVGKTGRVPGTLGSCHGNV